MVKRSCGSLILVDNHSSIEELQCSSALWAAETFLDVQFKKNTYTVYPMSCMGSAAADQKPEAETDCRVALKQQL